MSRSAWPAASRIPGLTGAYVSLALAGLMFVYSFLNYYHQYPWTTFYQEWGTAAFGVGAATLLLGAGYWRQAAIPRIAMLPLGLLLLVVIQYGLGKMPYFGQMLLVALYLMWAALLVMLGARLRELLGLPTVATALAVFLLIGAELGALLGMHQHYQWHSFLDPVVTMKVSPAVFGNVAQPNHYADYETLGLVSLGLLYARGALRAWQVAPLAVPILFVLPLTGSREIWFYLAVLVVLAALWPAREPAREPARRALLQFSLAALVGFGLMHLVLQLPWLQAPGATSTVERMFGTDVRSGSIRLGLWAEAAQVFLRHPLVGAGFGEYGWQHFLMTAVRGTDGIPGLYNNAHNVIMDVAAEGGLAGVAVLLGTLWVWARQAARAPLTAYHWWGYALLAVLGIHSLLEYPLWYAYFLGIAAVLLGLLDDTRYRIELGTIGRVFMVLALLLGGLSLQQLFTGYRTMESLNSLRYEAGNEAAYYGEMKRGIAQLQGDLLLQPYADMLVSRMIEIDPRDLAYKLELNGKVERYIPTAEAVYRQAMLLAQNGDTDAAQAATERAIWAYPGDYGMAEAQVRRLAERDPAHFNGLLEFMIQKYEEYRSAIHSK